MTKRTATMIIPKNAFKLWTDYMTAEAPVPEGVAVNEPICQAEAVFKDGVKTILGVLRSNTPDYNIKFAKVLDKSGNEIPGVLDVSDHETFMNDGYEFELGDDDDPDLYVVKVVEEGGTAAAAPGETAAVDPDAVVKAPAPKPGAPLAVCLGRSFWHELPDGKRVPGGMAANAAWILLQLGVDARIVSAVGDDAAGKDFIAALEARGLDASGVAILPGLATAVSQTKLDKRLRATVKLKSNAPWDAFQPTVAATAWAAKADVLCLDTHFPAGVSGRAAFLASVKKDAFTGLAVDMEKGKIDAALLKEAVARANFIECREEELKFFIPAVGLKVDDFAIADTGGEINTAAFYFKLKEMGLSWAMAIVGKRYLSFIDQTMTGGDLHAPEDAVNSIGCDAAVLAGSVAAGLKNNQRPADFLIKLVEQTWLHSHGMPVIPENIAGTI